MTTDTMREYLCHSGIHCADSIDGHAREVAAAAAFCDACLQRTAQRVAALPRQYVQLHQMIGDRHAGIDAGIRRAKPGSTVLLNLHIDTLMGDIADTVTLAAELLADRQGIEDPTDLAAAAALVSAHIGALAMLQPIEVMFWLPAGTAFGIRTTTGVDIVAALDRLATLTHFTLGQTRARTHRDLPCTRCGAKTVGRWAGSDDYDCTTCGARFCEDDLHRQCRILLALYKRGMLKV